MSDILTPPAANPSVILEVRIPQLKIPPSLHAFKIALQFKKYLNLRDSPILMKTLMRDAIASYLALRLTWSQHAR